MQLFKIISVLGLNLALALPAWPASSAHRVHPGDSLWKIAAEKDVFNDPWKWPLLLDSNRDKIDNPDLIQVGSRLSIPREPSSGLVNMATAFAMDYNEEDAPHMDRLVMAAEAKRNAQERGTSSVPAKSLLWFIALTGLLLLSYLIQLARFNRRQLSAEEIRRFHRRAMLRRKGQPQPTESEAIVRAMLDPDPELEKVIHHEAA